MVKLSLNILYSIFTTFQVWHLFKPFMPVAPEKCPVNFYNIFVNKAFCKKGNIDQNSNAQFSFKYVENRCIYQKVFKKIDTSLVKDISKYKPNSRYLFHLSGMWSNWPPSLWLVTVASSWQTSWTASRGITSLTSCDHSTVSSTTSQN